MYWMKKMRNQISFKVTWKFLLHKAYICQKLNFIKILKSKLFIKRSEKKMYWDKKMGNQIFFEALWEFFFINAYFCPKMHLNKILDRKTGFFNHFKKFLCTRKFVSGFLWYFVGVVPRPVQYTKFFFVVEMHFRPRHTPI